MNRQLVEQIILALENDFHGDIDLLLNHVRSSLEEYKISKKQNAAPKGTGNVIIDIKNLSREYIVGQEKIHALKDINLEIYEGEIVALIGPSGSGKSTLLNLIGGLDTPSSGEIKVSDLSLKSMNDFQLSTYRNQTIGFIFQFFNLQPYLSVQENVEIPLIFRGEAPDLRAQASLEAVKAVGLEDRIKHLPNQLSGGQMQRVAIARSIVNKPKIILADEPTGNLDRNTGIEILNVIKEINKELNTTIILVTHDNFVANQADRIIQLSDGKLV
jgi:putative ABC transport system ATP-binding protein